MMSAQLQQPSKAGGQLSGPRCDSDDVPVPTPVVPDQLASAAGPMRNRAGASPSPFVRAHSDTLVTWQPLDHDTVSRANRENKLIFLSIGFLASHYCHLTRQESFSHPKVASLINENFVPILIDREERPDLDNIYMSYNQSLSGSGGWPLNVFLTPDLEPVFSGTYWAAPGVQDNVVAGNEGGEKPLDWLVVIQKVLDSWLNEESRVREEAKKMVVELGHISAEGTLNHEPNGLLPPPLAPTQVETSTSPPSCSREVQGEVDLDQIEEAYERITRNFDPMFGGFGREDKFLTPAKLSLLLRIVKFPKVVQDIVGPNDCAYISGMGLHTLRRIASGAIHDHIGGGFHRYSITRDWSLPAFEKMLIDNALLLGLFLDAWLTAGPTPNGEFADVVTEIADYIISDRLLSPQGGFFTSEAADSSHRKGDKVARNGAYYLWTRREFDAVVGDEQESMIAAAYWNVQEHGNVDREYDPHDEFLNQNVLHIVKNSTRLSKHLAVSEDEVKRCINAAREKLRSHRQKERVQPDVDTKIVASYNGMAIAALARAALAIRHTQDTVSERVQKYLRAAKNAASFIRRELWDDKKRILYRVYSDGRCNIEALAEDYAYLIEGLIELYQSTAEELWLEWADELQALQIKLFYDNPTPQPTTANARCGAFYSTALGAPFTLLRIKDAMDTSQPSVNAVSVSNLFRLGGLLGDEKYTYLAKESLNAFGVEMLEHPNLFPGLLCGVVPWRLGGRHWISVGDNPAQLAAFYRAPRAALFTIRFHDPQNTDTWLNKRDPRSIGFPQQRNVYAPRLDGTYREINSSDVAQV
ncbi:hypothetical protein GGS23DRAFT_579605 [Durotheca rogersii]|uniref:uncharacterized protein n=1 Tax=Durotheca rogersii TaxID=419775 RepID=UPI00221E762E|nr:uncharacterized protein GGS23DRAFT_579605 [Durotheca rogersii]KAI5860631.1 hypothetical protein GGS23DRAFT_579605 [Durotheca rogersii]